MAKNSAYYQKVITHHTNHLNYTEDFFKGFTGEITRAGLISKVSLFSTRLSILIASYSMGLAIDDLKKQFSETVGVMAKVWDRRVTKVFHGRQQEEYDQYRLEPHVYMMRMLSLGVLLEVPKNEFGILVNLVDRDKVKDKLFETLIRYRFPERPSIEEESYQRYLMIPKMYSRIKEIMALEDKAAMENAIKIFLDKHWFRTYKNLGGWESEDTDRFDINSGFVGFWAFEVAAVVKIKGLDDSSFRDNRFYPDRLI